jgi:hypothetical protein
MNEEATWKAFEQIMQMYENKVLSESDLEQATPEAVRDFRFLLKKRLLENEKGLPTVDEVDGLKILALDVLNYCPKRPPSKYGAGQF